MCNREHGHTLVRAHACSLQQLRSAVPTSSQHSRAATPITRVPVPCRAAYLLSFFSSSMWSIGSASCIAFRPSATPICSTDRPQLLRYVGVDRLPRLRHVLWPALGASIRVAISVRCSGRSGSRRLRCVRCQNRELRAVPEHGAVLAPSPTRWRAGVVELESHRWERT